MNQVATTKPRTQQAQLVVHTSFWIQRGARCQHKQATADGVQHAMHHLQCKTLLHSSQSTLVGGLLGMEQAARTCSEK
jgi:hypothetical protein